MVYSSHAKGGWQTVNAWDDCKGQQHRWKWTVIQSEGGKDGRTDNMHHKTHLEGSKNDGTLPQIEDCERHWVSRKHIHSWIKHSEVFKPYTAQVKTYKSNKQDKIPYHQIKGVVLVQKLLMMGRAIIWVMKPLRLRSWKSVRKVREAKLKNIFFSIGVEGWKRFILQIWTCHSISRKQFYFQLDP